jgi:Ca2+-binding RTX toxin-like protein
VTLLPLTAGSAAAVVGPVGNGFTVTTGDIAFILKQIKIAEAHSAAFRSGTNPDKAGDPEYCASLIGTGPDHVPDALTAYGLRTVDGGCNNLVAPDPNPSSTFHTRRTFGAADVPFPRLTKPVFRDAEASPTDFFGPGSGTIPSSSYKQKKGLVFDSQPRLISNLIVDQTSTNPAAVAAAGFPVRAQAAATGVVPCATVPGSDPPVDLVPATPTNCVPAHQTLFIENVTTDVGLSPPYNSLFTFFGQFFDHGVDQTVKGGGTVFVPLKADDPLIAGPDHILGNSDDLPASQRFMVLTRAQNQPGPDGVLGDNPATPQDESADDVQDANNTDTPWVDQSQTYTSHASHQVFLREYELNAANHPVATGKLLGGIVNDDQLPCTKPSGQICYNDGNATHGSISTWASTKKQAAEVLGLLLQDKDVTDIPMIAADPYGNFIPGPARGLPQYVTASGLVEGDLANPVPVPANVKHFDTPFLTDIAHNADPSPVDADNNPATPKVAPTPDADSVASADFANQAPGTYDDEMLNDHFTCGDGRCNENIALSTIHQVFHHEHDRLVDDIKNTLTNDTSTQGVAALAEWKLAAGAGGWNGERLFQAARFVTEMEYQHLVFEEFARKVQPAVRPFHVYVPDTSPAIDAEFAHAVYRFGHSMLDDTVARTVQDPATGKTVGNSLPLLTAFLNPPEYFDGGPAGTLTPEQAAGSIVMGSSDQAGNELDEFVTETLRNNLLGLPLDLATLNLTRAREAGIPPLNDVRRQIFAQTNDGQLAPYTSWSDFGQHLKHPESLINFVAAYGTHPSIVAATTLTAKRDAARAIVNPLPSDVPPADAAEFMFSTGAWASDANGVTTSGLDSVDLWVGGLAEVTNLFGGLLGSTFNYVFQSQLEKLQEGDRFYYLGRTPGLNLRTQLEGNSFSELIQRNTDGTNSLKADAFATADCKFELGDLTFPATAAGSPNTPSAQLITGTGSVNDDLATSDCDENQLLLRKPDGTIQYRAVNSVDPVGINGQSVYNGTDGVDRMNGGNDNDTFWGGKGNDIIEGNGGDDIALGGEGNDIITDLSGADVEKGGPGNDALDAGIGDDIMMGGDGADFMNGGANDNEEFAGPGNDFVIAGQGADAVFGDGGDDWIEGGSGQDLLQGDHGAPFFDDPGETQPGNDIMIGQPGENDYDAEGGDDVMSQNAAIDRNAGAGGFDWAFHQYNTVPAADDMMINNNLGGLPIQVIVNRDRWQETEADSGSRFNDTILGQDGAVSNPRLVGGGGFTGCDAIDAAGLARIKGLDQLLPPIATWQGTAAEVAAISASGQCPLSGPVWGEGDILIGGPGSDTITGRSGDEVIDGDKELKVAISVRTDTADPATEIGRTDLMEAKATSGSFGPGTSGMTLQQAVFAGLVDPGNLVGVREIVNEVTDPADCAAGTAALNCDTAVFAGPASQYDVTANANGSITVHDTTSAAVAPGVAAVGDGTDTLFNIEQLRFSDGIVAVTPPVAPSGVSARAGIASALVSWTFPSTASVTSFSIVATPTSPAGPAVTVASGIARTARTRTVTGLVPGTAYTFQVRAVSTFGGGPLSDPSPTPVTPIAAPIPPSVPLAVTATAGNGEATVSWTAPAPNGGPAITSYQIVTTPASVGPIRGIPESSTSFVVTGLLNGVSYSFEVRAENADGDGALSAPSNVVTPTAPVAPVVPAAPSGVTATRGNAQASVSWSSGADGGSPITGYRVQVLRNGGVLRTVILSGTSTSTVITGLVNGTAYSFRVMAVNAVGLSPLSAASSTVTPMTVPGAPTIGTASPGAVGGSVSATVRWNAPAGTGGSAITGYRVSALRIGANGAVLSTTTVTVGATLRARWMALPAGKYRFTVVAVNALGASAASARSNLVTAR